MTATHAESVQQQFDSQARAYLESAVHAAGPDLVHAGRWLARWQGAEAAIDVGCGAGHLAFAMARHVRTVVASDPSPGMLATVAEAARARGLENVDTCLAAAERLPYDAGAFAVVGTRYSAHHWLELEAALAEMHRVLRADGSLLVVDLLGADGAIADTHLQAMELLRDPSHVRDRSAAQWHALLEGAGFSVVEFTRHPVRLDFETWTRRMRTPPETVEAIRRLQRGAPSQVQAALSIEPDGSFTAETGVFVARRAAR